uniref:Olfactory receptor n=1 Tax=Spermophilus dauricus TaxID=99837 RepID=A0A8C9UQP5_SPEDA
MDGANHSVMCKFVFLGLSNSWEIHLLLFLFSSVFYLASLTGNLLILFSVTSDSNLHCPMYILLAKLSFLDLGGCSIVTPKIIYDLFRKHKAISFGGCIAQIFFIHVIGDTEMVLLIAMAFDRYVAICKPLHYLTIMGPRMCIIILVVALVLGLIHSVTQLAFVVDLPFCGPNVLDSFYCDLPQLIRLACTKTDRLEFMVTANSGLISALSTLSAHVTVVVLFFGPLIFFYTWPFPSSHVDKFLAIFDGVLTPFLNPVIYTFRNKEMKAAMRKPFYQLVGYRKIS